MGLGESFGQLQKTRGSHCSHQPYRGKVSEIVLNHVFILNFFLPQLLQVVSCEKNAPQEWKLRAAKVLHLNLLNACILCDQVPPCLLMEGQTEEGWQGHLCGAAEGPRQKAGAGL